MQNNYFIHYQVSVRKNSDLVKYNKIVNCTEQCCLSILLFKTFMHLNINKTKILHIQKFQTYKCIV